MLLNACTLSNTTKRLSENEKSGMDIQRFNRKLSKMQNCYILSSCLVIDARNLTMLRNPSWAARTMGALPSLSSFRVTLHRCSSSTTERCLYLMARCSAVFPCLSVMSGSHPLEHYTHYSDSIMSLMASQITGASIVCSTVCSGVDQRKHQSCTSVAFVRGNLLKNGQ